MVETDVMLKQTMILVSEVITTLYELISPSLCEDSNTITAAFSPTFLGMFILSAWIKEIPGNLCFLGFYCRPVLKHLFKADH